MKIINTPPNNALHRTPHKVRRPVNADVGSTEKPVHKSSRVLVKHDLFAVLGVPFGAFPAPSDGAACAHPVGHHLQRVPARHLNRQHVAPVHPQQPVLPVVRVPVLVQQPRQIERWRLVILLAAVRFVERAGVGRPFGRPELAGVVDQRQPRRSANPPACLPDKPLVPQHVLQIAPVSFHALFPFDVELPTTPSSATPLSRRGSWGALSVIIPDTPRVASIAGRPDLLPARNRRRPFRRPCCTDSTASVRRSYK